MIINWVYDSGEPHYMEVIDRWTEPTEPVWRFRCKSTLPIGETRDWYDTIVNWLEENCQGGYDYTYRFNDGDPYLSVELLHQEDFLAFRMRFE